MIREELPERDMFGARPGEYELPEHAFPTKCESCHAAMAWARTKAGKMMPLSLATVEERDGKRYALPHWIDCPDAAAWKGKQQS